MAAKGRKGRTSSKRKGPGGPNRSSSRVTEPGGSGGRRAAAPSLPPVESLVDIVLAQFGEVLPPDSPDPQHVAEIWADEFLSPSEEDDQIDLDATMALLAQGLAARADEQADLALAGLARAGRDHGTTTFAEAWAGRSQADDVEPRARTLGQDVPGEAVEITHPTGDGVTLLVELANPAGDYCVGVYLDHNLGGMLTDVVVGPPLDEIRAMYQDENPDEFTVSPLDTAALRTRCFAGIARTERTPGAPVSDDFFALLPFVARRIDLLPAMAADAAPVAVEPVVPVEDRRRLVESFLASPEAADLSGPATGEIAGLWVDHALDATLGGPFRVSPALVELFVVDWFPRKVVDPTPDLVAATPAVLAAWLRHAARSTDLEARWLDDALVALDDLAPTFAEAETAGADHVETPDS